MLTKSMITMGNINMPELIQIGQIPQSWSCERENTESENNMIFLRSNSAADEGRSSNAKDTKSDASLEKKYISLTHLRDATPRVEDSLIPESKFL